ncbi:hypothetical protein KJ671_02255 [Patescibacteria group bacterium]|nr:hypothetical protein [Patescibacteria group bacterium]
MKFNKDGKSHESIKEYKLSDGTIIGIFQGERGENPELDILIKYKEKDKRIRTPKHIHWAIDLLIKKEHEPELTLEFVKYLRSMWEKVEPFRTKEEQEKCEIKLTTPEKLKKFEELNKYGEYRVMFIGHLIELMMRMEKTGLNRAFMFKGVLDAIIAGKDIFSIVAQASQVRR